MADGMKRSKQPREGGKGACWWDRGVLGPLSPTSTRAVPWSGHGKKHVHMETSRLFPSLVSSFLLSCL